ncbi:DUF5690 family protein [Novosphingobium sp. FKTRR1]|uniref:DUF5690 family protein n=1 Tax=Novosphingobium sp. FKTRR1 TaxID=2879118 RepID=UPI001CF014AF
MPRPSVSPAIPKAPRTDWPVLLLGGLAAFSAYFAMYAFRKPIAAASFAGVDFHPLGLDYKSALIIAQVLGYALSKLIGIRVIAQFGRTGRARAIALLIGTAWLALVGFALLPPAWGLLCLFLNGLPLGMIWGLVFSYVEGRRVSELLGSMLCASFILSSGLVKSVATLMLHNGVSEQWMPAATGILFVPLLALALWQLERLPPPSPADEAERAPRVPMDKAARSALLRENAVPLALLVTGYVLLTAIRDFRDNFAAELWQALGYGGSAAIYSESELPVTIAALAGLAALMLVRSNLRALLAIHALIVLGAAMLGLGTLAFQAGLLAPLPWMILTGTGLYLAYTPFNAMLFDRMIAALGRAGNAGFLIYVADASGYGGSVALLLWRNFATPGLAWLPFYIGWAYATAVILAALTIGSALSFIHRARSEKATAGITGSAARLSA